MHCISFALLVMFLLLFVTMISGIFILFQGNCSRIVIEVNSMHVF